MPVNKDFYMLAGSSGQSTGYTIDQSIRFNGDNDDAYMERTHGSGGNTDLSTISFWFKRSKLGVEVTMFGTGANVYNTFDIFFKTDDTLFIQDYVGSYTLYLGTNMKFRDPSAWYHLVFVYDSGNDIETERCRLYINGERVTSFGGASPSPKYPSKDANSTLGTNQIIGFGRYMSYGASNTNQYYHGYLAEMHYLNGYGYGPEYFGEFDDNGIWIPKEYTGSYGSTGWYIKGADSSALGTDYSGNGNNMTTVGGLASNDQRADSPTNNHVTFNVAAPYIDGATHTFKNGSLDVTNTSGAWGSAQTTMGIPGSGKWTFAVKLPNALGGSAYPMFGIIDSLNQPNTDGVALPYQSGTPANSMVYVNTYQNSTQAYFFKGGNGSESTIGSAFAHGGATNGEWQWFINSDDKELTVYHNGTVRLDAYDISFLTFPVFMAATLYDYDDLRLLNEPGTEYTPSISGYKAINSRNIGAI